MRKRKSEAAHGWDREECFQEESGMSSPIVAPQGSTATQGPAGIRAAGQNGPVQSAQRSSGAEPAVSVQALPSSPPPEVLEQMASAAERYDELTAQGREMRFARDEQSGRTRIELRDREGHLMKMLSPAEALDVAAGGPLN